MRTDCHSSERRARDHADRRDPGPFPDTSSAAAAANNLAWICAGRGGALGMALALAQLAGEGLNPADADHRLGWVYYRTGLPSLAIDAFRRSLEKDPTNPLYIRHLALAYAEVGDWSSSKHCLEEAASERSGERAQRSEPRERTATCRRVFFPIEGKSHE